MRFSAPLVRAAGGEAERLAAILLRLGRFGPPSQSDR